ncbi:MAG: carbohydrate ABC transporter permease, partial [Natronospirillum sp.]
MEQITTQTWRQRWARNRRIAAEEAQAQALPRAFQQPPLLKLGTYAFLAVWLLIAAFPLFWVVVMSFKMPVDAFAANPLQVLLGTGTREVGSSLSLIGIVLGVVFLVGAYITPMRLTRPGLARFSPGGQRFMGGLFLLLAYVLGLYIAFFWVLPPVVRGVEVVLGGIPVVSLLTEPILGYTLDHYHSVWVENRFYRQFRNSMIVTFGVVTISLTVGTLAAYALSRRASAIVFWLLIAALVFRALPHSVLVTGYMPVFIQSREILQPLWELPVLGWVLSLFSEKPPTLYGQPLAVIAVLVAINQPFTIWMLRSFFMTVPKELDEAARIDGCSHFQAFRRVIVPVMWPGVITTGLFAFLL